MSTNKKTSKVKVKEDGSLVFTLPFLKPRNPNLPKGSQKHEDKRKKKKHKEKYNEEY